MLGNYKLERSLLRMQAKQIKDEIKKKQQVNYQYARPTLWKDNFVRKIYVMEPTRLVDL